MYFTPGAASPVHATAWTTTVNGRVPTNTNNKCPRGAYHVGSEYEQYEDTTPIPTGHGATPSSAQNHCYYSNDTTSQRQGSIHPGASRFGSTTDTGSTTSMPMPGTSSVQYGAMTVIEGGEAAVIRLPTEIDPLQLAEAHNKRRTDLRLAKVDPDAVVEIEATCDVLKAQKWDEKYHPVNSLQQRYRDTLGLSSYRDEVYTKVQFAYDDNMSVIDTAKKTENGQDPRRMQDYFECELSVQSLLELRKEPTRYTKTMSSYCMLDIMGCLVKYEEDLARLEESALCDSEFDSSTAVRMFREEVTVQMCIDYKNNESYFRKRNLSYLIASKSMYELHKDIVDRIDAAEPPSKAMAQDYEGLYPHTVKTFYLLPTKEIFCWHWCLKLLLPMTVEHANNVDMFLKSHETHLARVHHCQDTEMDPMLRKRLVEIFNSIAEGVLDSVGRECKVVAKRKKRGRIVEDPATASDGGRNHSDETGTFEDYECSGSYFSESQDDELSDEGSFPTACEMGIDHCAEKRHPNKFIEYPNCDFPLYSYQDHLERGLMGDWKQYVIVERILKHNAGDLVEIYDHLHFIEFMTFWASRIVFQFFSKPDGYGEEMEQLKKNLNSFTPVNSESIFKGQFVGSDDVLDPEPGYGSNKFRDLTYYQMLGIQRNADDITIKRAFRKKASVYHPDKLHESPGEVQWDDVEDVMVLINAAKDVLLDTEKRQQYDHFGRKHF